MFKLPDVEGYIREALQTTKEILDELKAIRELLENQSSINYGEVSIPEDFNPSHPFDLADGWLPNVAVTRGDYDLTWNGEDTNFTNKDFIQDYYNRIDERNK